MVSLVYCLLWYHSGKCLTSGTIARIGRPLGRSVFCFFTLRQKTCTKDEVPENRSPIRNAWTITRAKVQLTNGNTAQIGRPKSVGPFGGLHIKVKGHSARVLSTLESVNWSDFGMGRAKVGEWVEGTGGFMAKATEIDRPFGEKIAHSEDPPLLHVQRPSLTNTRGEITRQYGPKRSPIRRTTRSKALDAGDWCL